MGAGACPLQVKLLFFSHSAEWVIMKSGCQLPEILNYLSFHIQMLFFFKVTLSFWSLKITQVLSSPPPFLFRDFKSQRKEFENDFFYCHPFVVPFSFFCLICTNRKMILHSLYCHPYRAVYNCFVYVPFICMTQCVLSLPFSYNGGHPTLGE